MVKEILLFFLGSVLVLVGTMGLAGKIEIAFLPSALMFAVGVGILGRGFVDDSE